MRRILISIAILTCFHSESIAQTKTRTVLGLVKSAEDGRPIEGATVWVKGTKNYSGSQPDGIYYITIEPVDTSLVFTYPGLEPVEVKLSGESEYNVELKKAAKIDGDIAQRYALRGEKK